MSQVDKILEHIKERPITPLDALNLYKCFRLAARIHELRGQGHVIVNEPGYKGPHAIYKLLGSQEDLCDSSSGGIA